VADWVVTTGRSGTDAVLRRSSGSLARLDAVVFTGEIGWDQPEIRSAGRAGLDLPGVPLATGGNRDDDGAGQPPGLIPTGPRGRVAIRAHDHVEEFHE
jgi:hypothetical protein